MLEQDYQAELSYLREAGQAFAQQHPALAGMLTERGTDPDVERLLEGFAFLSARLRRRIDDAAPELGEALAEWLLPHTVRPQPAATVVEFRAAPKTLRGCLIVPQGTRLFSRSPRCTFTTHSELAITPLQLHGATLDDVALARPSLRLEFELEEGAEASPLGQRPVRVQLHAEPATSAQLLLWLARHLVNVRVVGPDGRVHELGTRALRVPSLASSAPLFPWPAFAPHSARVLTECFALPAKFTYFELLSLDRAVALAGPRFTLALEFAHPPPLPARLPERAFRLHCVPAVNLFQASAEPLRAGLAERPQLLRAVGVDPAHMEVFSVDSVIGVARDRERRSYPPLYAFREDVRGRGFYKLQRRAAAMDAGTHTFLSLHRDVALASARGDETLSIELTCSNRGLARQLAPGDLCEPSTDVPAGIRFSNIGTFSAPARPALGSEQMWQLLSQLASTRRGLADLQVLRGVLSSYAADPRSDDHLARVHRARIDAIRSVRAQTITRVVGGVAARGSLYEVELDERGFASEGDAWMFGAALHAAFAIEARVNTFADLRLQLAPSGRSYRIDAELAP